MGRIEGCSSRRGTPKTWPGRSPATTSSACGLCRREGLRYEDGPHRHGRNGPSPGRRAEPSLAGVAEDFLSPPTGRPCLRHRPRPRRRAPPKSTSPLPSRRLTRSTPGPAGQDRPRTSSTSIRPGTSRMVAAWPSSARRTRGTSSGRWRRSSATPPSSCAPTTRGTPSLPW